MLCFVLAGALNDFEVLAGELMGKTEERLLLRFATGSLDRQMTCSGSEQ